MSEEGTASEDFAVSPLVRALLSAGIAEEVDYDFDEGLQVHLAAIGVAPALPHAGPAVEATKVAASLSAKAVASLIAVPVAAASLIAGLLFAARPHDTVGQVRPPAPTLEAPRAKPTPPAVSAWSEIEAPKTTSVAPAPSTPSAIERQAQQIVPAEPRTLATSRSTSASVPDEISPATRKGGLAPAARFATAPPPPPAGSLRSQGGLAPAARFATAPPPPAGSLRSQSPATSTHPSSGSTSSVTPPAPGNSAESVRTPAVATPAEPARAPDDALAREMADLVEAKRTLSSDPRRALELSERGQREFPHGLFHEERVHILLLALIELGRVDDARRLAAPYLRDHPDSPFARRVQNALESAAHSPRP